VTKHIMDRIRLLSPLGINPRLRRAVARARRGYGNRKGFKTRIPVPWCMVSAGRSRIIHNHGVGRIEGLGSHPELRLALGYTPKLSRLDHFERREAGLSHAAVSCAQRLAELALSCWSV
jgi:hypothetical protein